MANKKSKRNALLGSVVSLMMCVTMLLGTTFAWFTDEVTSANNKITAGTLKIDLELLDKTSGEWNSIKKDCTALFSYENWEPGYTDVKILKIENEGSLALKWMAKFASTEKELSKLANVIDVYVYPSAKEITYPNDRDLTGYTKVGTVAEFVNTIESTTYGNLEAGKVAYLGIALKMKESAGNDYQKLSLGKFDIMILATQLNYEIDSFDKNYDVVDGFTRILDDGSTVFYYNQESGFGGRVRLIGLPENIGSEYVVPAEVNDLGGVLVGIKLDKLTIPAGVENAYKSLEGANIKNIVLEEGTTTIPNRMFYKTNVENVVIPSSVITIEQNAFAMAGPKELTIPASVTAIGEAAFQHMPNLTTVTIKGNAAVEGYAFRGCAALRTVYLTGDNVTFVPSATGKNSCWFCNGESNNPNTSNITFYTENETVAARVKTAMGAEANNTKVYVDGQITVKPTNAEELLHAMSNATAGTVIDATGVAIAISEQMLYLNGCLNLKGATIITNSRGGSYIVSNEGTSDTITFEGCTFKRAETGANIVAADEDGANLVFNDCIFEGPVMPNMTEKPEGTIVFNNCTFKITTDAWIKSGYVNCMGGTHTFKNCTFDFTGGSTMGSNQYVRWNAVNSYSESYSTSVILEGCTFINCGTQRYGSNSTLTVK